MKRLRSVVQTTALFACVYLGMAVEAWFLGAPKDRLYANGVFALVGFAFSGGSLPSPQAAGTRTGNLAVMEGIKLCTAALSFALLAGAAHAQPLRCPPGTMRWADGWMNRTCRSIDTGKDLLTVPNHIRVTSVAR